MYKHWIHNGFLLVIYVMSSIWITTFSPCLAQEERFIQPDQSLELNRLLEEFEGNDWRKSDQALSELKEYFPNEHVILSIIAKLNQETRFQKESGRYINEGRREYYLNLLEAVTSIKNDSRIIPPLIESLGIVGGNRVPSVLAEFKEVIEPLVAKYEVGDEDAKIGVLNTFKHILIKRAIDDHEHQDIKSLLMQAVNHPSPFVRIRVIGVISALADKSFVPTLERISREDSYKRMIKIDEKPTTRFPVREEAEKVLKELGKAND